MNSQWQRTTYVMEDTRMAWQRKRRQVSSAEVMPSSRVVSWGQMFHSHSDCEWFHNGYGFNMSDCARLLTENNSIETVMAISSPAAELRCGFQVVFIPCSNEAVSRMLESHSTHLGTSDWESLVSRHQWLGSRSLEESLLIDKLKFLSNAYKTGVLLLNLYQPYSIKGIKITGTLKATLNMVNK